MKEILTILLALLGTIGLIFAIYYASKWINKRGGYGGTGTSIKIIERYYLGQDKAIIIARIGSKIMLLGVTGEHIDKIADLDESDIAVPQQTQSNGNAFLDNLKKAAKDHQFVKPFIKDKQGEENSDE